MYKVTVKYTGIITYTVDAPNKVDALQRASEMLDDELQETIEENIDWNNAKWQVTLTK